MLLTWPRQALRCRGGSRRRLDVPIKYDVCFRKTAFCRYHSGLKKFPFVLIFCDCIIHHHASSGSKQRTSLLSTSTGSAWQGGARGAAGLWSHAGARPGKGLGCERLQVADRMNVLAAACGLLAGLSHDRAPAVPSPWAAGGTSASKAAGDPPRPTQVESSTTKPNGGNDSPSSPLPSWIGCKRAGPAHTRGRRVYKG